MSYTSHKTFTDRETDKFFVLDDRHQELYDKAHCRNVADSKIFFSSALEDTSQALEYCELCPVKALCADVVMERVDGRRPWFTGVAGGKVWIKGSARRPDSYRKSIKEVTWRKPVRWANVLNALTTRQKAKDKSNPYGLSAHEVRAACVVGSVADIHKAELARRLLVSVSRVYDYIAPPDNTPSSLTKAEYSRAQRIGFDLYQKAAT